MLIPPAATMAPPSIPSPERQRAVAAALQLDEAVADEGAGGAGQQDGDEGGGAGGGGGQRRQRSVARAVHRPGGYWRLVSSAPCRSSPSYRRTTRRRTSAEVVDLLRKAVPGIAVLVVDDASPDGTADVARRLGNEGGRVDVLVRHDRRGLGSAYREGFRRAIDGGADVCVQIDADLSHDPADLPALLANVEHGADLAIGSRYVPGGRTESWSWQRRWLSRWGNRYAAGVLGLAVNDATAGYRAYRAEALEAMEFETVTAEGYGFQIEMTHRLVRAGGRIVEFPIEFRDRRAGDSKLSQGIVGEALGLVLRLWLADRRGRRGGAAPAAERRDRSPDVGAHDPPRRHGRVLRVGRAAAPAGAARAAGRRRRHRPARRRRRGVVRGPPLRRVLGACRRRPPAALPAGGVPAGRLRAVRAR